MIRVGTRGSKLSLAQTKIVLELLKNKSDLEFEIVPIKTKGDTDARPLYAIDRKGIFEKEIDSALLDGKVDFAVHSMKDLPSELPEGLTIASVPEREMPNDVLVSIDGIKLNELRSNSVIGTSSLRRAVQLKRIRSDLIVKPIRGNVETRVRKMLEHEYDALILAEAGLKRLGMQDLISERLSIEEFVPSPGQGAIAIVARADDSIIATLKSIEDKKARLEIIAERFLLQTMNAGCRFPLGAISRADKDLTLFASVCSIDGKERIDVRMEGSLDDALTLGKNVAYELEKRGALKLASEWRSYVWE